MAIQMQLTELKTTVSRSEQINTDLSNELSKMKTTLDEICSNVQSSELTGANQNLVNAIDNLSVSIKTNFPKIIEFLNSQIVSYEETTATAKSGIDSLVSSINSAIK